MKISAIAKQKKIKIGDLFSDLGIEPRPNSTYPVEFDLKVKTPYGYYPIDVLFTTEKQTQVTTYFTNGKTLTTSPKHLLKLETGEWVKVCDLKEGDEVQTDFTGTVVKKQIHKKKEKVLYDMTVRDVHSYYSNGILSHNSWTCVAAAAYAVKMGFNVIYYTLELAEAYVGKRFDSCLTGVKMSDITSQRSNVESILENLPGNLIIKEYSPKSVSINTIRSHVQRTTDMGYKPDLIIIDYVDYLKPPGKGFRSERKDEIDDVYIATKALAKDLKVPILTPSQVNRTGAKDDVIEGDKAAGSYDKMMVCDIAISLSRRKEDKVNGTGRLHIMKNRYGHDGMTYDAKVDTDIGRITIEGLQEEALTDNREKYSEIAKKLFASTAK